MFIVVTILDNEVGWRNTKFWRYYLEFCENKIVDFCEIPNQFCETQNLFRKIFSNF